MLSVIGTLIGLFIVMFVIRAVLLVASVLLVYEDDTDGTMIIDFILNAMVFAGIVIGVNYKVIHLSSELVYYGLLIEVFVLWFAGPLTIYMSKQDNFVRDKP
jgi:hypothetical protein